MLDSYASSRKCMAIRITISGGRDALQATGLLCLKLLFLPLLLWGVFSSPGILTAPDAAYALDIRAVKLQEFFSRSKCAAEAFELIDIYLESADKYGNDYRLLPAISIQESSCHKRYPGHTRNPWGWASARVGFDSLQVGVDFISDKLANGKYYAGKTLEGKLQAYNPNPEYTLKIKLLMEQIENP